MANGDVYQVAINYLIDQTAMANVIKIIQIGSDPSGNIYQHIADSLKAHLEAAHTNIMCTSCTVRSLRIRRVFPGPPGGGILIPVTGWGGGNLGAAESTSSCVCITLYTTSPTKKGRGRMYIPSIDLDDCQDGLLNVAAYTNYLTFAALLPLTIPGAGPSAPDFRMGLLNETTGDLYNCTGTYVRPRLATLRSRTIRAI